MKLVHDFGTLEDMEENWEVTYENNKEKVDNLVAKVKEGKIVTGCVDGPNSYYFMDEGKLTFAQDSRHKGELSEMDEEDLVVFICDDIQCGHNAKVITYSSKEEMFDIVYDQTCSTEWKLEV